MKGIEGYSPKSPDSENSRREAIPYMPEARVSLTERLPMFFDESHLKLFRDEVFTKHDIEEDTLVSISEDTLRALIPLVANYFEGSYTPDDRLDRAKEIADTIKGM